MASQNVVRVKNNTSGTLLDKKLVYVSGFDFELSVPTVEYADKDDEDKLPVIGIVDEDILAGEEGSVKSYGVKTGFDTDNLRINDKIFIGSDGDIETNQLSTSRQIGIVVGISETEGAILFDSNIFDVLHSTLFSLENDDHEQYSLVNGSRAFTSPIGGVEPASETHLTTKYYVDTKINVLREYVDSAISDFVFVDSDSINNGQVAFWSNSRHIQGSNSLFWHATNRFLGIGTASPAHKLDVNTDLASGYVARFFNDGNNANRNGIIIQAGADDGSGTTTYISFRDGDGDEIGLIQNIAGAFQLVDPSDIEYKTNIQPTDINALSIINDLELIQFSYTKNPDFTHPIGFSAQNCEKVFPYMVSFQDKRFVSKSALIPVLVKALQEQQKQIEELKGKINAAS